MEVKILALHISKFGSIPGTACGSLSIPKSTARYAPPIKKRKKEVLGPIYL